MIESFNQLFIISSTFFDNQLIKKKGGLRMSNTNLPKDPVILVSFVNTQLRDHYASLDAFCANYAVEKEELTENLLDYGYQYNPKNNQFLSR